MRRWTVANHSIPLASRLIEDLTAIADDGSRAHLKVYEHTRAGHTWPHFYAMWYAERADGKMDRATRTTRQYSGATGRERLDEELAASRAEFAAAQGRNGG
jgi:hypothetical protein